MTATSLAAPSAESRTATTVAVLSGKGGVGKTTIAVNIAVALGKQARVLLVDGDSGLANAHILLGVRPARSLLDFHSQGAGLEEIVAATPWGVDLIAGCNGAAELLNETAVDQARLEDALPSVQRRYDFTIIDCPAGAHDQALRISAGADRVLIVLTAEPTSFLDAYSTIKSLHATFHRQRFDVLLNVVRDEADARRIYERFHAVTARFLDVELHYLGAIRRDTAVPSAITRCVPLIAGTPKSAAALDLARTAVRLVGGFPGATRAAHAPT